MEWMMELERERLGRRVVDSKPRREYVGRSPARPLRCIFVDVVQMSSLTDQPSLRALPRTNGDKRQAIICRIPDSPSLHQRSELHDQRCQRGGLRHMTPME